MAFPRNHVSDQLMLVALQVIQYDLLIDGVGIVLVRHPRPQCFSPLFQTFRDAFDLRACFGRPPAQEMRSTSRSEQGACLLKRSAAPFKCRDGREVRPERFLPRGLLA